MKNCAAKSDSPNKTFYIGQCLSVYCFLYDGDAIFDDSRMELYFPQWIGYTKLDNFHKVM